MSKIARRNFLAGVTGAAAAAAAPTVFGQSANTVRVGLIMPFSGPFAVWGRQFKQGVELYISENGKRAGNTNVEVIYRDEAGPNPEKARQSAQELIVREKADYLGGLVFTPNALAVAPVVTETKKPFVIFNAAHSALTRRSPYFARTSFTIWQSTVPGALWAAKEGIKEAVVLHADYAPGIDARDAFQSAFTGKGGTVKSVIAVPLSANDPAPYVQRVIDAKPGLCFIFMPTGPFATALYKTFADLGAQKAGIRLLGAGEMNEVDLPSIGDPAIGVFSSYYYSYVLNNPRNKEFTARYWKLHGADSVPDPAAVGAYDGMHVLYEAIRKTGGSPDGDKAMAAIKGLKWESPRGPMGIDPVERDVIQDMYIRRVEKRDGKLVCHEIEKFAQVKDPWKEANKS
jgi:branched-chain amino acid transport system substrate-binding protein